MVPNSQLMAERTRHIITGKKDSQNSQLLQHILNGQSNEDWNYFTKPWTRPEDFPKFAAFPVPADSRLKLMRKDKVTGQMTWMNLGAGGGGAAARSGGPARGRWEAHPSFEEAMLLEGELTYGECLPGQGETVGTYTESGYFFRPPNIRHGGKSSFSPTYTLFIFRSGKQLWADYFEDCNEPKK